MQRSNCLGRPVENLSNLVKFRKDEITTFALDCRLYKRLEYMGCVHQFTAHVYGMFEKRTVKPSAPDVKIHGCVGWNTASKTPRPPITS